MIPMESRFHWRALLTKTCTLPMIQASYIHILFNNAGLKMAAEADVDLLCINKCLQNTLIR